MENKCSETAVYIRAVSVWTPMINLGSIDHKASDPAIKSKNGIFVAVLCDPDLELNLHRSCCCLDFETNTYRYRPDTMPCRL